jgi:hypothetical protein
MVWALIQTLVIFQISELISLESKNCGSLRKADLTFGFYVKKYIKNLLPKNFIESELLFINYFLLKN